MLFQIDLSGSAPDGVFRGFWDGQDCPVEVREFAERLVQGTWAERERLDRIIAAGAEHWRLDRMATVDRNVLRMAAWEMLFDPETPAVVVIDEAIEVAKKFGSEESGRFINGILDGIRRRVQRGELKPESR